MLAPIPISERLKQKRLRKKNKEKVAKGVKNNRSIEAKYNRELQALVKEMHEDVKKQLFEQLKKQEYQYVNDSYANILGDIIFNMANRWRNIGRLAKIISSEIVNGVDKKNKEAFYKSMEKATGVSLNGIISEEGLEPILTTRINENINLIQSIPDEYFKKLNTIVTQGTTTGKTAGGITKEIFKLGQSTKKRARLIARDQTQKLNAAITEARQEALGIKEYIWRTSADERVRDSHKKKNGKRFKWSDPPKDTGHPGQDIQCRCTAEPVISFK